MRSPACERYRSILAAHTKENLKLFRHREWLKAATATLEKSKTTREICHDWSHAADEILKRAWHESGLYEMPIALFALGKLGAEELNLSSDVDLIVISASRPDAGMQKAFREFTKSLTESDEYGSFTLRLDFDLRPGGRFASVITPLPEAENYYWTHGAPWERLALVRLRPVIGPEALTQPFAELAQKFSYRKYVDYSFLEHIKGLRSQIHNYYEDSHNLNLKLAVGGIRDIELFCHALQVIHGGRIPALRISNTDDAFAKLIELKLFDVSALSRLRDIYWYWRQIENEVQAHEDQQTHLIPRDHPEAQKFLADSAEVDRIVTELLGKTSKSPLLPSDLESQKEWLGRHQFSDRSRNEVWPKLVELTAKSTRTTHDEKMRQEFLYQYVEQLSQVGLDKDLGLHLLNDLLLSTRAKATFFSLFVSEPRLVRDIARLFSVSPYLGGILSSRPELIDSFLYKAQGEAPEAIDELLEYLTEKRLLSEILSSISFLDNRDVEKLGHNLSQTADDISNVLLKRLCTEHQSKPVQVLALGKWGGRELGLRSDLDFIFICDSEADTNEHKVAKRFISRLTEPHRGGMIYSIDLRLRPSGKAGPIIVEKKKFLEYIAQSAEPWERQSYLRGRLLNNDPTFAKQLRSALFSRPLTEDDLQELRRIREALLKPIGDTFSLKYAPGGLLDIELASQTAVLFSQKENFGTSTSEMLYATQLSQNLTKSYHWLREIEQIYRLVSDSSGDLISLENESFVRMASFLKTNPSQLFEQIVSTLTLTEGEVKQLDPIYTRKIASK